MDRVINHAIVGCGRVAPNHAHAFAQLGPDVVLHTVADSDHERATKLAHDFQVSHVATDYRLVLEDPTITSVSLTVPHDLHAPMTLAAIEHGKHVLVEKPFVLWPEEGHRVIEASERTSIVVMPVAQQRMDPLMRAIAELVHGGEMGGLVLVRGHLECHRLRAYYADSAWRGTWLHEGGSILMNQAYHLVDLVIWLGGPVADISAHMATRGDTDVMETENVLTSTFRFRSGALGSVSANGAWGSHWLSHIEVVGDAGLVVFDIDYPNHVRRLELQSKRSMQSWRRRFKEIEEGRPEAPPGLPFLGTSHRELARCFVNRVQGLPDDRGADLHDSLAVIQTIHDIYVAARAGGFSQEGARGSRHDR